jgi:TrmH family RNA methyltransferase
MNKKIVSLQHPLVKHLVKIRSDKKARTEHGSLLIAGANLVPEVCAKIKPLHILATDPSRYPSLYAGAIEVTEEILKKITGLESASHIAAEVPLPKQGLPSKLSRLLVVDQLSDPGNLGTLIRTALAFKWDGIFLLEGSVDLFNEKVIRSAKGAMFRLPYLIGSWEDLAAIEETHHLARWVADLDGSPPEEIEINPKGGLSLILGSEAHGPSDQAVAKGGKVTLKMGGDMESLNVGVAGGILMYYFMKEKN